MRCISQPTSVSIIRLSTCFALAIIAFLLTMGSAQPIYAAEALQATPTPEPSPTVVGVPTVPVTPVPAEPKVVISEIYYHGDGDASGASVDNAQSSDAASVDSQNGDWIELENRGDETVDLSDWWLNIRGNSAILSDLTILAGNLLLEPGKNVVVVPQVDMLDASDLGLFADDNGEQPAFDEPTHMVAFVQWGSNADLGLASVAVAKGLWQATGEDTYSSIPAAAAGESLGLVVSNSTGSSAYRSTTPSEGEPNIEMSIYYLSYIILPNEFNTVPTK